MTKQIAMAGYGAVGRSVAERLSLRSDSVVIVQRHAPPILPPNCTFKRADPEDAAETQDALAGANTVVCAVGVPYVSAIYTRVWRHAQHARGMREVGGAFRVCLQPLYVQSANGPAD